MPSSTKPTTTASSSKDHEPKTKTATPPTATEKGQANGTATTTGVRKRIVSDASMTADTSPSNPLIVKFSQLISARSRTIYVMYFIAFLDLFAVSLFMPLLNGEIRKLGASHFMTGLIGSAYGAIQLISSPVMGRGSDKYGPKPVLVLCLLSSAFAYVIQGVAITMTFMLIARALAGTFKHTQTISKSIISELTPKDKSYVLGNFNAFGSMGFILGPTIGAHIYETANGWRTICCLAAIAFVINTVLLLLLVPEPARINAATPSTSQLSPKKKSIVEKIDSSNSNPDDVEHHRRAKIHTLLLLVVRFLFSFATLVFRETLSFVLRTKYNTQVIENGYLTSLQALVTTVIGFTVGPLNKYVYKGKSFYMVIFSGIIKSLALFTLFWTTSFRLAATMLLIVSALNPFLRVEITALSLEGHTDLGTILGLGQSATAMARMLSPAVSGLAVGVSLNGPFLIASILAALSVIITLIAQGYEVREDNENGDGDKDNHPKRD